MTIELNIKTEHIKLGQALKLANVVENGAMAKDVIGEGLVEVNGEVETRRGKKLYVGDKVIFEGNEIIIED